MSQQAAFQFAFRPVFQISFWMDSVWDKVRVNGPPEQLCKLVTKLIYCSAVSPWVKLSEEAEVTHTHKNKNHRLLATYTMLCTWVRHDTTCPSYCVGKQYINSKHLCFDTKYKQQFPKQLQKFYFLKRFLKLCFMKCHCVFTNLFYIMFC